VSPDFPKALVSKKTATKKAAKAAKTVKAKVATKKASKKEKE
jgi:hypothetical protein